MTNLSGANLNSGAAVGPQGEGRESPSTFPAYSAYKDSGVEWLGKVPGHWIVTKFSRHFSVRMGETIPETELSEEGWLPVYSATERDKFYGYVDERKPLVENGDLVIPARGNSIGFVKLVRASATATQTTIVANVLGHKLTDSAYIYYWCLGFRKILFYFDRTAIPQITTEYVSRNPLLLPDLTEQTQIARFLDHETARIDALIEEQRRLIELLKEKRQAVISHAVTKGLDPTVPMKDSGVEWLGKVPAHWERKRLKNISPQITVGIVVNPSEYISSDGLPYLYGAEVKEGWIDLDGCRFISSDDSKKNPKTMLAAGDLVTMRVGYPGITAVVTPECEGGNCASIVLIRRGGFDSHWLCAAMNSQLIRHQVELVQYGAAQKAFNVSDAVEFWLYEPPYSEQLSIANFIRAQSLVFDDLIAEAKKSEIYLHERRSALISAAVTGKIDVRGWQPPASIQAPELAVAEAD